MAIKVLNVGGWHFTEHNFLSYSGETFNYGTSPVFGSPLSDLECIAEFNVDDRGNDFVEEFSCLLVLCLLLFSQQLQQQN